MQFLTLVLHIRRGERGSWTRYQSVAGRQAPSDTLFNMLTPNPNEKHTIKYKRVISIYGDMCAKVEALFQTCLDL